MRHLINGLAVLFLLGASGAHAGVVITSATHGGGPTAPNVDVLTFDNSALGAGTRTFTTPGPTVTLSFTGDAGIVNGDKPGIYAEPYSDATNYVTTGKGSATFTFSAGQTYFGLLWGSVDEYNTLTFYDAKNHEIGEFDGEDIADDADGNQGYSGTYYVNFSSNKAFTKVVASSSNYAFEFDNVAVDPPAPAPEPASLAILGGGLALLTAARRRAKR